MMFKALREKISKFAVVHPRQIVMVTTVWLILTIGALTTIYPQQASAVNCGNTAGSATGGSAVNGHNSISASNTGAGGHADHGPTGYSTSSGKSRGI